VTAPSDTLRILIVEDDLESASSLAQMLEASGYRETRVVRSGEEALAVAVEFRPALVLLELDLPDMSGYEVAQQLHQRAQLQDLRLIALTGSRKHTGRERARAAGFERYLLKPVGAAELAELFVTPAQ
jgi:CheY-like chemotaxis protein